MSKLKQSPTKWTLDESKLTDEQKQILKFVSFPKEVKAGNMLQKRVRRKRLDDRFVDFEIPSLDHLRYLTCGYTVAQMEYASNLISETANDGSPLPLRAIKIAKQYVEKKQRAKGYKHIFISTSDIDQELEDLFAVFATPSPSKNMIVEDVKNETVKETPKKPKGLSPTQKSKAKEMHNDLSMDAQEIAAALDVEVERVIDYLKKL